MYVIIPNKFKSNSGHLFIHQDISYFYAKIKISSGVHLYSDQKIYCDNN